jgi:hypothetical protein
MSLARIESTERWKARSARSAVACLVKPMFVVVHTVVTVEC